MKKIMKTIKFPNRKQIINTTMLVLLSMIIISTCIFMVDTGILKIYNLFI